MAVIQVIHAARMEKATRDDSGVKISQTWYVWATNGTTALDALLAGDLPQYGEQYGTTGLRVRNVSPGEIDIIQDSAPNGTAADLRFTFTVDYSLPSFDNMDPDPLERPAEIQWAGGDLTEVMMKDWDNTPCTNSADDMYDPLPERYIRSGDVTITRNEADNAGDRCVAYNRTTNSDSFWGAAANTGLMGKITSNKLWEIISGTLTAYWRTTYPISFRSDNWRLKVVDNGWNFKIGTDKFAFGEQDQDGNWSRSPVPKLLDGAAGESTGSPPTPVFYPTTGFKQFDSVAWSTLSLPDPWA